MPVGKIAVLRCSLEVIVEGLSPSELGAPFPGDRWKGYSGANGSVLHAAALEDGTLVVPFGVFDSAEEVALAVRGALGAALDRHEETRGLFIADSEAAPEGSYETAVSGSGSFVPVPSGDDPRLAKKAGWSFAAAAGALVAPDAKKRVEAASEEDPLASAQATLDKKLAEREDRSHLRRTLSAALNHEIEHSELGKPAEEEDSEGRAVGEVADRLMRAVTANPEKASELESALRAAVDTEIARSEEIDESQIPAPAAGDDAGATTDAPRKD